MSDGFNSVGNLRGMNNAFGHETRQRNAKIRQEATDHKKLEAIRCEYEAMLTVLSARVGGANDFEDWNTILNQTWALHKLAVKAHEEAGKK